MTERRITRRQALLAGGSAVVTIALGAGTTRALGGAPGPAPLLARGDFLPLVGTELRATASDGTRASLRLAEVADLRRAPRGSADAFELLLHGPEGLPWSSDVVRLQAADGREAHLLVSRSALPRRAGGQQLSAIINRTTVGQEV